MRPLNVTTFQLEEFPDELQAPSYAILLHTWGAEEVALQQFKSLPKGQSSLKKIESTCLQALKDHLHYIWVDTCCIDKTNSSELAEAINSMFRWYEKATICYAYLEDVQLYADSLEFRNSRWFRRGWTLQELLAPSLLRFFNASWIYIGDRVQLSSMIMAVTKIDITYLGNGLDSNESRLESIYSATVAKRMSWASERVTTRVEDMAYCLLGLFGVNMPMLYGEGERAFVRLQEEILKDSIDMTIFAWGYGLRPRRSSPDWKYAILAQSPADFAACGHLQVSPSKQVAHYAMTNVGLHITLPLITDQKNNVSYALLDSAGNDECCIAIPLDHALHDNIYRKRRKYTPILVSRRLIQNAEHQVENMKNNPIKRLIYQTFPTEFKLSLSETIYISRSYQTDNMIRYSSPTGIEILVGRVREFRVKSVHPPAAVSSMYETSINAHLDAELVVIHFANDNEKQEFMIVLQRQKTPKGTAECFLSIMEQYSALEAVMFGSSALQIKIQEGSVDPTPLELHCKFSAACTYTMLITASTYGSFTIDVISRSSFLNSKYIMSKNPNSKIA